MKTRALVPLLLLAACASHDGFIDQQVMDCSPGQSITIQAGLDGPGTQMEGMDDQHMLAVLVGNNSHEDIVVKFIRVDQHPDSSSRYRFNGAYKTLDETVAEGAEGQFRIPLSGRALRPQFEGSVRATASVSLDVTVGLSNGDQYRCAFEIPVR